MAYLFADGFDNYGNSINLNGNSQWEAVANATAITTDSRFTPPGGTPGGCVLFTSGNPNNSMRKNLPVNAPSLVSGFGIKFTALPLSGSYDFHDYEDTGTVQVTLSVNSLGALQFYRGTSAGTAIGPPSANGIIAAGNQWYGIATVVTFNGSTGSVAAYVNGNPTPVITATNLNTISSANAYANQVSIGVKNTTAGAGTKADDFYCLDTTTATLNGWPGYDVRIITKLPSGAGFATNWTPNGLASNWQNAAVIPPNTTDYNANNVVGTKDYYAMTTAGLSIAPLFVLGRASLTRDDANTHTPSIFIRSNGSDSSGTATPALTSTYQYYDAIYPVNPITTIAWTATDADNAQMGIIEG